MADVKSAILKALIDGAVCELLVKTGSDNVYLSDGTTTLSAKLAEIIAALNLKATQAALEEGLNARPTTSAMNTAIQSAIDDLINGAPDTYNTLKELADYIDTHEDVVETLNAAIGDKADASVVATIQQTINSLGSLASKSTVSESDLDAALKAKVNAAADGNHSHSNKAVLDGITAALVAAWNAAEQNAKDHATNLNTAMDTRVKAVEAAKHSHANQTALDGVTAAKVAAWDGKGKFYASATQPSGLTANDLWAQLI